MAPFELDMSPADPELTYHGPADRDARVLSLELDHATIKIPLYRQVYARIREGILQGRLPPGVRLPSTRALAAELGVARNTVLVAYDQLAAEGLVQGRVGAGTRVSMHLRWRTGPDRPRRALDRAPAIARRARLLGGLLTPLDPDCQPGVALAPGPDASLFPLSTWQRIERARRGTITRALGEPIAPLGYRPLQEAISVFLGAARGIAASPGQIVVTTGAQQALDLVARTLLDEGDRAVVEDPGYPGAVGAFVSAGATVVSGPVDDHGLRTDHLGSVQPRVVYCTPSHQCPLGMALGVDRRGTLLEWAADTGTWILEDDSDCDPRFGSVRTPALVSDPAAFDRVVYIGSFSNALAPSLRLGFAMIPPALIEPCLRLRVFSDLGPPLPQQIVLADFIADGHLARHLQRTRKVYQSRLRCLVASAEAMLTDPLRIQPVSAGLGMRVWLPAGTDDVAVCSAARAERISCRPLSPLFREVPPQPGLLLGFASTPEAEIASGVERLARAVGRTIRIRRGQAALSGMASAGDRVATTTRPAAPPTGRPGRSPRSG